MINYKTRRFFLNKKEQKISEETKNNIITKVNKFIEDCSEMLKISISHKKTFQTPSDFLKKEIDFINDSFDEDQRILRTQIRRLSLVKNLLLDKKDIFTKDIKKITQTIRDMNKLSIYRDNKFIDLNKKIGLFNSMSLLRKKKNIDLFFDNLKDNFDNLKSKEDNDLFIEDDTDDIE